MAKKILVADDDPAIVEATTLILEEFGYDVDSTVDGQTIYKMEKDFPDLLLLDIWMSGQDGREICKYLKKRDFNQTYSYYYAVSQPRYTSLSKGIRCR